jgi:AcrR family transcriptional regulator
VGKRDKRKKKLKTNMSTRELIVLEAERIISAKGVDGLRLEEITHTVGIQRPSLYSHFSGRNQLLAELITRAMKVLSDSFDNNEDLEPLDNIRAGARFLVRSLAAHPAYVRILMLDFASPNGMPEFTMEFGKPGKIEESGALRPLIDRISELLRKGQKDGTLRHYDPLILFHNLLCLIVGRLALEQRKMGNRRELADLTSELEQTVDDLCVRLLVR